MISGTVDPAMLAFVRAVASSDLSGVSALHTAKAVELLISDTAWAIAALADISTDSKGTTAIRKIADAAGYGEAHDLAAAVIAGDIEGGEHEWREMRSGMVPVMRCHMCGRVARFYDGDAEAWLAGSCPSAVIRDNVKTRKEEPEWNA